MAVLTFGGNDREFTPAPAGVHRAVLVDIIDMGWIEQKFQGEAPTNVPTIRLAWQIDAAMDDGRPFVVSKRYRVSLNEKANLAKDVQGWLGRRFSTGEQFDIDTLLGQSAMLNVVHAPGSDGRVWANIQSIMPLMNGLVPLAPRDYIRLQDRPEYEPPAVSAFSACPPKVAAAVGVTNIPKAAPAATNGTAPAVAPQNGTPKTYGPMTTKQLVEMMAQAAISYGDAAADKCDELAVRMFGRTLQALNEDQAANLIFTIRSEKPQKAAVPAGAADEEKDIFDGE